MIQDFSSQFNPASMQKIYHYFPHSLYIQSGYFNCSKRISQKLREIQKNFDLKVVSFLGEITDLGHYQNQVKININFLNRIPHFLLHILVVHFESFPKHI